MEISKEIHFIKNYSKIQNQKFARLIGVFSGMTGELLRTKFPDLMYYDTALKNGMFYQIEKNQSYLMLLFLGNRDLLFTSFRKENEENIEKYADSIGDMFKIVIDK